MDLRATYIAPALDRLRAPLGSRQVRLGAAAGLLLFLWVSFAHYRKASGLDGELRETKNDVARLAKIVAQVEEMERISRAVKVRLGAQETLVQLRRVVPCFLEALHAKTPPGVDLDLLSINPNEPSSLVISASRAGELSAWVGAMSVLKSTATDAGFREVVLISTSPTVSGGRPALAVDFRVK